MTPTPRLRVAVIGGGANGEHEVSLASAAAVARALADRGVDVARFTIERDGVWRLPSGGAATPAEAVAAVTACDLAFPVLHGVKGEDGAVAGFLELIGMPYVGSPVAAGAFGMDKAVTKLIAAAHGIRTAAAVLVEPGRAPDVARLRPPYVVKPVTGGSSDGVVVAADAAAVPAAVAEAREFSAAVLVEEYVAGREVDVAVYRGRDGGLRLGSTLEIGVPPGGVFDRARKYDGSADFTVPARIDARATEEIRRAATLLYDVLGCRGVARFDFFVTGDGVVLNEVNTSPGMTERSQVPLMFADTGLPYAALVADLVDAAMPS